MKKKNIHIKATLKKYAHAGFIIQTIFVLIT